MLGDGLDARTIDRSVRTIEHLAQALGLAARLAPGLGPFDVVHVRPPGDGGLRFLERGPGAPQSFPEPLDGPLEVAPFVGRLRELDDLVLALADAKARRPVAVLVHGEPGMGKTALVRRFLDDAAEADPSLLVLSGRCYEQESLPFKAFDAIIDARSRRLSELDESEARLLLRGGVRFLATMFPVLRRVGAGSSRGAGGAQAASATIRIGVMAHPERSQSAGVTSPPFREVKLAHGAPLEGPEFPLLL